MRHPADDPFGLVGQVLDGQFRVDSAVGDGGFSAVYRGFHLGLQEPIAVKCLKLPAAAPSSVGEDFERRFRDESRILYRLSQGNLNIVRSMGIGTWRAPTDVTVPYMVLEWLEGRSLADDLAARRAAGQKGRSVEEVLALFEPAADGLGFAHSQGVVHRDVNPGNLFLASTPRGTRMKVLDFGVAKILDESALTIARTQTVGQLRAFAPAYGAPEQFDDKIGAVGPASDVYSFALVLLEALRDQPVNDGEHLGELALRATDPNARPTPRSLGVEVPHEVEAVFARATALDPRARWQSVGAMWQALAKVAGPPRPQSASLGQPPGGAGAHNWKKTTRLGVPPPFNPPPESAPAAVASAPAAVALPPPPSSVSRPSVPRASLPGVAGASPPRIAPPPLDDDDEDEPTRIGSSPELPDEGDEEEVTRVQLPEEDILRGLAAADEASAPPPASAPAPVTSAPAPAPLPHPPANRLAQTMPLAGPYPGLPQMRAPSAADLPAPPPGGAPPAGAMGAPAGHAWGPAPGAHPAPPPPAANEAAGPGGAAPPRYGAPPALGHPPFGHPSPEQVHAAHAAPYAQAAPLPAFGAPPQAMYPGGAGAAGPGVGAVAQAPGASTSKGLLIALVVAIVLAGVGGALAILALTQRSHNAALEDAELATAPLPEELAAEPPPAPPAVEPLAPAPPPALEGEAAPEEAPAEEQAETAEPTEEEAAAEPDAGAQRERAAPNDAAQAKAPAPAPAPRPRPAPVKTAAPVDPDAFNEAAARSKLAQANGILAFCKRKDGVTGPGTAAVTFGPDGAVSKVAMDAPYAGTPAGDCVTGHFNRVKVNAFKGPPKTVRHAFTVPK